MPIASQLQLRRGTTPQHAVFTGAPAEVTVDTDKKTVVVHDGSTAGGFPLSRESVIAAGSVTRRSISDRFADTVNVKDFGAVGDGVTDDWLAIQRALAAAANVQDAATLTMPAAFGVPDPMSISAFGVWIPKLLYWGVSTRMVYFPSGKYAISRPLVTSGEHFHLLGHGGGGLVTQIIVSKEAATSAGLPTMFNAIEPLGEWVYREITAATGAVPTFAGLGLWPDYAHNSCIENITVLLGERDQNNNTIARPFQSVPDTRVFVPFTDGTPIATMSAVAGSNTITVHRLIRCWVGMQIKARGDATTYTVASFTEGNLTIITTVETVTSNIDNAMALWGKPAGNGIVMNGGENILIKRCYANCFYTGSGFVVANGSPAPIIDNCMSNLNKVGYEIEAGPALLIKPSGDNNLTFIRCGFRGLATLVVENMKVENFGVGSFFGFASGNKELFQIAGTTLSGRGASIVFVGGSVNIHTDANDGESVVYAEYSTGFPINIQATGVQIIASGRTIHKKYNLTNNTVVKRIGRGDALGTQYSERYGGKAERMPDAVVDWNVYADRRNALFDVIDNRGGISADSGSGRPLEDVTFTRAGSTVTFTANSHGLQVGNLVSVAAYKTTTPANTVFTRTDLPADNTWYLALYVKSVNGNDFTCTVVDSGPTSGAVTLVYGKYWDFHAFYDGRHIVQIPSDLGGAFVGRSAFMFQDLQNRDLAGLRVATPNEGDWWSSKSLNIGGAIDAPAVRLLHGSTAPSVAAPTGSLYFQTDRHGLWMRHSSGWQSIGDATQTVGSVRRSTMVNLDHDDTNGTYSENDGILAFGVAGSESTGHVAARLIVAAGGASFAAGTGCQWSRRIRFAVHGDFVPRHTNDIIRIGLGYSDSAAEADIAKVPTDKAVGVEIDRNGAGDVNRVRLFAHNGTALTNGSWQILPGDFSNIGLVVESIGDGNVRLFTSSALNPLSEVANTAITGGPSSVAGAGLHCLEAGIDIGGTNAIGRAFFIYSAVCEVI